MCGITGWIDWKEDLTQERPILERMTEALAARGPDAFGYWVSERAAIGHRRLVVVDPEGGKQPMVRQNGSRHYVLTYNGELYNTEEVRRDLLARGRQFQSYSDTEVVLVSYMEWGTACVDRFNGIFAFGIWDEADQSLFLARDRMGVKPLFYTERNGSFLFGSELKALLAHPKVPPEVDWEGFAEIFGLGPARTPGHGIFQGIHELRPGCWLTYDRRGTRIHKYWELKSGPHADDLDTTTEKVRFLVEDSIRRQLVSDVPVCTFLSGGLDSSIISATTANSYRKQGKPQLVTYSIDYVDNDKYFKASDFQPNSDPYWAAQMAKVFDTDHRKVLIDTPQLAEALQQATLAKDLPGMADVDSSLYLFCREIKKGATVALSGECADEVFGGYPWFYRPETVNANTFPWSLSTEIRNRIIKPELRERLNIDEYIQYRYREALAEVPRYPEDDPSEARRRELFYLNINWFMALLLERKDRMSMASGLEVRVPFCDHRLVEYVWNIPWEMKSWNQREKGILRRAVRGLLPDEIIDRKKSPYPKTHNPSYLQAMRSQLGNILEQPNAPLKELIDLPTIKELVYTEHQDMNRPWFGQLMTLPQLFAYLIQINEWLCNYKVVIKIN
ncbi:MAG TPA: asparagine synthase (glutamine-hydrolyzing) [Firmicutes bacterium]|jgi:asparagine synthase (glutamine-hydrolysing)|nr:asparagine synthase (glutamine-hydrolyzing) [Bacillota bacterium]